VTTRLKVFETLLPGLGFVTVTAKLPAEDALPFALS